MVTDVTQTKAPVKSFSMAYILGAEVRNENKRQLPVSKSASDTSEPKCKREKLTQYVHPMPRIPTVEPAPIETYKATVHSIPVPQPTRDLVSPISEEDIDILADDDGFTTADSDEKSDGSVGGKPSKKSKRRVLFSKSQLQMLERKFQTHRYVTAADREMLARELKLTPNQIKIWFQNHRYKTKKSGSSFDINFSHFANPFYMAPHNFQYGRGSIASLPIEYNNFIEHTSRLEELKRLANVHDYNTSLARRAASLSTAPAPPLPTLPYMQYAPVVNLGNLGPYYPNPLYHGGYPESISVGNR